MEASEAYRDVVCCTSRYGMGIRQTHRNNQDIIGNIEFAACVLPILPLEGLAVLARDGLAHWVHIYTLRLQVVALHAHLTHNTLCT